MQKNNYVSELIRDCHSEWNLFQFLALQVDILLYFATCLKIKNKSLNCLFLTAYHIVRLEPTPKEDNNKKNY